MSKLSEYLGQNLSGEVSTDNLLRNYFAVDAGILRIRPQVVIFPRTIDDIRKTTRFAWRLAEKGIALPITARGYGADNTGSSIGSGVVAVFPAHMSKVLELDTKIKKIRVQPGLNMRSLEEILATHGLFFPIYPPNLKFATIGGVIAGNTGGPKSLKYGSARDWVDRLEVVLSNGEIIQTGNLNRRELSAKKGLQTLEGEIYRELDALIDEKFDTIMRNYGPLTDGTGYNLRNVKTKDGFDLTPLLVGSGGTLAITTQAILKTIEKPAATALMIVALKTMKNFGDIVEAVNAAGPSEFEFIDGETLKWVEKNTGIKPLNTLDVSDPAGVLIIELDDGEGARSKSAKKLYKVFDEIGALVEIAETADDREDIWAVRYAVDAIMNHHKDNLRAVQFADASVPPENIKKLYQVATKLITIKKLRGFISGRVGAGNITVTALVDLQKIADRQAVFAFGREFYKYAGKLGGEISGDSCDGRLRQTAARGQYNDEMLGIFEKVKNIFDPKGILNPGVILDSEEPRLIALLNPTPPDRFFDYQPRV
ncbi:MAG: FAD-binding oxidoreductase [Candidatus Nomurabacteria bacterium]|jgi:FAD/FMN-containing dehydrogenase|nr:FAD-binding oxidoreductase [Candidatus Nomurabacteria bacterium]